MDAKGLKGRDTIFALASGAGRCAVALIRISGPDAKMALHHLTSGREISERKTVLRPLFGKGDSDRIDIGLVTWMPAPASYTGEDVAELGVHGGRAVVTALLQRLGGMPGLRMAEPGEFTRRALLNGRIDLTQAEAVADLIDADTDAQRRQAVRQLDGALGARYENWRVRLIRAAAWLEASIDFADEEIPLDAITASRAEIEAVGCEMRAHLDDGRRGEIQRDGFHVAIVGPPNAGKSSLINALAQRDLAIVSAIPGTTRDVLEVKLDLGGYAVVLADTAGLREPNDAIEREGVRRARARAEQADLRLLLLDGSAASPKQGIDPTLLSTADLIVLNKSDVVASKSEGIWISAKTGEGLDWLIAELTTRAGEATQGEGPALTRIRHRRALENAHMAIVAALDAPASSPELAAEGLRVALNEIGRVNGRVDIDDLLDVVFRDFCIGK